MSYMWNGDKVSLRIGVDLDDVVYNFTKAFQEAARRKGWDVGENDCWDFHHKCGMSDDEFADIMHFSVDDLQLFWRGGMLDNAADWISKLKDAGHEIHIVTHRYSGYIYTSSQATKYWLNTKGVRYDSLTFSGDKTIVPTDVFIEDKIENYDALEAAGTKAYLVNRPYNQIEGDERRRVDSFGEFADLIIKEPTDVSVSVSR